MSDASLVGMSVIADASLQRHSGGTVLMGGSPLRVMRITETGARLIDRLLSGEPVPDSNAAVALTRRLLDGGLIHPNSSAASVGGMRLVADAFSREPFRISDVPVVIPVRGELPPRLVHSVGRVAHIIVIDDCSPIPVDRPTRTDDGVPNSLHRRAVRGGPAAARNTGLAAANTPLIAFIDSDCEPEPDCPGMLLPQFPD